MTNLVHEIHTSERKSFKGCRFRWDLHFRQCYTPLGMPKPLEFGIAYHKAMEVLYNPQTWGWPDREVVGELAVKTFVEECEKQKRTYLKETGHIDVDREVEKDYAERVELGKGMLRYFYRKQLPNNPEQFKPIAVEVGFQVPINNPETGEQLYCKCDTCWDRWIVANPEAPGTLPHDVYRERLWQGLPVVYAGRIDALVQDANGDYWIVDWKTAAQINDDEEFLELDDQIASYVWALAVMLGLNVRGFVYHQQKKGFPKPPNLNKHQRLGCWFSVSKNQDTDYETFLETVKEEDAEAYKAGAYDNFLEYLKHDGIVFYKRNVVIKTEHQLKTIERYIYLEALDMTNPNVYIYPNSGRFSCKYCAFRQPCLGVARGEDVEYGLRTLYKKELPYYYRQAKGASTESKGGE